MAQPSVQCATQCPMRKCPVRDPVSSAQVSSARPSVQCASVQCATQCPMRKCPVRNSTLHRCRGASTIQHISRGTGSAIPRWILKTHQPFNCCCTVPLLSTQLSSPFWSRRATPCPPSNLHGPPPASLKGVRRDVHASPACPRLIHAHDSLHA